MLAWLNTDHSLSDSGPAATSLYHSSLLQVMKSFNNLAYPSWAESSSTLSALSDSETPATSLYHSSLLQVMKSFNNLAYPSWAESSSTLSALSDSETPATSLYHSSLLQVMKSFNKLAYPSWTEGSSTFSALLPCKVASHLWCLFCFCTGSDLQHDNSRWWNCFRCVAQTFNIAQLHMCSTLPTV